METQPLAPSASPSFVERNRDLAEARNALLKFGTEMNMFGGFECGCNNANCYDREPAVFTTSRMLSAIGHNWDPAELPEDKNIGPMELRRITELREALLTFGYAFNLFTCPCDAENCPSRNPNAETTQGLLVSIDRTWHGRAGCYNEMPSDAQAKAAAAVAQDNLKLLQRFTSMAYDQERSLWDAVAERTYLLIDSVLIREATVAADHSIATWMPGYRDRKEVKEALAVALRLTELHGMDEDRATRLILGFEKAIMALLTYGIVHKDYSDALYEAMEPKIPINEIRLDMMTDSQSRWTRSH